MADPGRRNVLVAWVGPEHAVKRRRVRNLVALAAITYGVVASYGSDVGTTGPGLSRLLLLIAADLGWLCLIFEPFGAQLSTLVGTLVTGVGGVALSVAAPHSPAIAFVVVAVVRAANWWSPSASVGFALGLTIAYLFGLLGIGESSAWFVGGPAIIAVGLLIGFVRRQNERLVAEAQQVRDAQARSAALDERARIAREIHDVLAHSLAALSVQLETADALIESGRTEQAQTSVRRAGQLAREGLAESRRAIGALRGDTLPLPDLVTTLAAAYEADSGVHAAVDITGDRYDLRPDVSLTLYRSVQEAITNVRKHAPGAPVGVRLAYRPSEVALTVTNGAGPDGGRPLADAGGGYGLTGLRERAELAGGEFDAGPFDGGWRVNVRIPS